MLRLAKPIPMESIATAELNYLIVKPLTEAIFQFQEWPELKAICYDALKIENPVTIIDGIDLLALDYSLPKTKRSFKETDFSYLDDGEAKKGSNREIEL